MGGNPSPNLTPVTAAGGSHGGGVSGTGSGGGWVEAGRGCVDHMLGRSGEAAAASGSASALLSRLCAKWLVTPISFGSLSLCPRRSQNLQESQAESSW